MVKERIHPLHTLVKLHDYLLNIVHQLFFKQQPADHPLTLADFAGYGMQIGQQLLQIALGILHFRHNGQKRADG